MSRKRQQIHTECLNVYLQLADRLHGIGMKRNIVFLGDFTYLFKRLDSPVLVVDVHDRDQHSRVPDRIAQLCNVDLSVSIYRKIGYLKTALLQILAGMQNRVVFHRGSDDMVAFAAALLQLSQSFDGVVIRLSAAARENNFTRTFGTDEFGDLFARGINRGACLTSVGVNAGTVPECLSEVRHHRVPNFRTERGCGVVV